MKKYEKLLLPVSIIIAAIVISIGLSNFNHKKPTKQIQKKPEKKVEEVKDVSLLCEDPLGGTFTIVFNDKNKSLKENGSWVSIISWSDSAIVYQHGEDMHSHRLDRISGYYDGDTICFQTYGKSF